jgi:phosphoribosylformylglycinamidine synthase subunit PurS
VSTYRFEVVVGLKEGLADPAGRAVADALPALGWTNVREVRMGKSIVLGVDAATEAEAEAQVAEMADRFLANPVIERYHVRPLTGGEAL